MRDQEQANELLQQIGGILVRDEKYADGNWDALAVAFTVREQNGQVTMTDMHGFRYEVGGDATPATPRDSRLEDAFLALRDAMQDGARPKWQSVLVQIQQPGKIGMDFEYDNPDRWHVTPANLAQVREQMRPR